MGIEVWGLVVILLGAVCWVLILVFDTHHMPPIEWELIRGGDSEPVPYIITESRLHSCINAYSIKHGYLPTKVSANYETIHTLSGFCCHTDAGLVLPTGDVVKIELDVHSNTNDLTLKGNANDTTD